MHFDNNAPAPPIAAKYTALFLYIDSMTLSERFPLPIIPFNPCSSSNGVYLSIRLLVVGPAEPMTCPSLAGDGPR